MWQLYKYQPLNKTVLSNLAERKLWASHPSAFNDLFELRLRRSGVKGLREYRQQYPKFNGQDDDTLMAKYIRELQNKLDKMGVICFTELRDNILMWSHYADSHKGICLGFCGKSNISKISLEGNDLYKISEGGDIFKVWYDDEYPEPDMAQTWHILGSAKILVTKHKGWDYEEEWRAIQEDGNKLVDYLGRLNEIIFGYRTTNEDRKLVQSILKDEEGLEYFEVVPDDNEYKLNVQPI